MSLGVAAQGGPRVAESLLCQAREQLDRAGAAADPAARFTAAYRAAHRAGAAVLVSRGRPHRGRERPESVWRLLEATAPELTQWAAYFAGHSARHAAARAGITRRITPDAAAGLCRRAEEFVLLAHRAVAQAVPGGAGAIGDAAGSAVPDRPAVADGPVVRCGGTGPKRGRRT